MSTLPPAPHAPAPNPRLRAYVLAGGSGTRLWPLSRAQAPKQFLSLLGGQSLLETTVARLAPMVPAMQVVVIASPDHLQGAGFAQLTGLHTLVEPLPRNTAPAVAVAAAHALDFSGEADPLVLILPADHHIADVPALHRALSDGAAGADAGHIVTFGIVPTRAETGYGYIHAQTGSTGAWRPVDRFEEKPTAARAAKLLAEGQACWNSGMFVAKASVWLNELATHAPEIAVLTETLRAHWRTVSKPEVPGEVFKAMPNISIDYALLEKSRNVVMVPADLSWSDVGSWDAVYDLMPKDADGNASQGAVVRVDSHNNLIVAPHRLVALAGVRDLCVVETPDAVLVVPRENAQLVKQVVAEVVARGGTEHLLHRTADRPWGRYTVLEDGSGYKLKRIEVRPGGRLSLQSHVHRSEHWVVVQGQATVTKEVDGTLTEVVLGPNESTYIPVGAKHRLENRGEVPVQLIEVQVGPYLEEDDITRYDDVYGRS